MKKFVVPESLLWQAKKIMERHTYHTVHCAWHMTEFCDCGKTADLNEYRELLKEVEAAK
jgi:hypothetical protein